MNASTRLTAAEVKKAVVGPGSTKNELLALNKIGEDVYATNRFWMVRAEVVAEMLAKVNLPSTEPATFNVKGSTITTRDMEPPRMESLVPTDTAECKRVEVAGLPAFVKGPMGSFLELYAHPTTDAPIALESVYVDVVRSALAILDAQYGERLELLPPRVHADRPAGPVAFYAKREVKRGGNYSTEGDGGGRHWVPESWEDGGEVLLGLVMPVRV